MFWGTWRVNGQLAVSRAIGKSSVYIFNIEQRMPKFFEYQLTHKYFNLNCGFFRKMKMLFLLLFLIGSTLPLHGNCHLENKLQLIKWLTMRCDWCVVFLNVNSARLLYYVLNGLYAQTLYTDSPIACIGSSIQGWRVKTF